jgi:hypothetical protein
MLAVKTYLTDPNFLELQAAYGPVDGFKPQRGAGVWSAKAIYLSERNLDAEDKAAKDPSIQAVGINGQVYGQRADITILDDAVDDTNADAYEKQFDWLTRSVMSRSKGGKIIVIGTRIKPADLYAHLLVAENYPSGRSPWTYLAQPAVLQFAEDPEDWVTLWPKSSTRMDETDDLPPDENGLYDAWTGPDLEKVRDSNRPGIWALVYQQQQVSEDMTFHPLTVPKEACMDLTWPQSAHVTRSVTLSGTASSDGQTLRRSDLKPRSLAALMTRLASPSDQNGP